MATVYNEPARVHDVLLWEEGMAAGEQRYTRKSATFKNKDSDHAAVQAGGSQNLVLASPTAGINLSAQGGGAYDGEAGNIEGLTLVVVNNPSEGVSYNPTTKVMTVTVDITGGHNTVNALNTVLTASADWVSTVASGGAGVITTSTTGGADLTGGQDAVPVATDYQVGAPLVFVTDHYEPVTQANESSAVAILLSRIEDIADDEEVEVVVLHAGPAIVNMDAFQLNDPYAVVETVMTALEALTPYSIDRVNEPVQQTSGVED